MIYVIQVLSAILIGIAIATVLGPRSSLRMGGAAVAIALALASIFTGSWVYLAIGTAIYLIATAAAGSPAHSRA